MFDVPNFFCFDDFDGVHRTRITGTNLISFDVFVVASGKRNFELILLVYVQNYTCIHIYIYIYTYI